MEHINHLTEELEIEEAISLIESGIDEDGTPLTEERIAEVEQRILRLDSLIRRRKKNTSNAKDRWNILNVFSPLITQRNLLTLASTFTSN